MGGAGGQPQSEGRDLGWMGGWMDEWNGETLGLFSRIQPPAWCFFLASVGLWLFLTYSGRLAEVPFCGVSLM